MPYGTPTRGSWVENLSGAPTITIPSHSANDLLLLYFAGFADEDTTALTADGWTRVSGADYIEGSLWNAVWEKLGDGVQTSVTVTDATAGGAGVVVVQPGGDVGCTLVYNDDNASNTQAVFTAVSGAGYRIGFAPIYGARTATGSPISLVSGTATHTSSLLGGNFLSTFSSTYRLAIGVFDVSAASSAVFGINWTTGNSSSNGLMVLVPERVASVTFSTLAGDALADAGSAAFLADAVFSTVASSAPADGGTAVFTASAVFASTVGSAPADGGVTAFTFPGTFSTTVGEAPADGGSAAFTAPATFETVAGDATADGDSGAFSGGAVGTFSTLAGNAPASGGSASFTAPATFSTTVGSAPADGGSGSLLADATFVSVAASAPADGGSGSLTASAVFVTVAALAPADGGMMTMIATATFASTVGTAAADGGAGAFAAASAVRGGPLTIDAELYGLTVEAARDSLLIDGASYTLTMSD